MVCLGTPLPSALGLSCLQKVISTQTQTKEENGWFRAPAKKVISSDPTTQQHRINKNKQQ